MSSRRVIRYSESFCITWYAGGLSKLCLSQSSRHRPRGKGRKVGRPSVILETTRPGDKAKAGQSNNTE